MRRITIYIYLLTLWLCVLVGSSPAQEAAQSQPTKTMTAVRINPSPPHLDGILDDEAWRLAPVFTGFIQLEPDQFEPATEKTEVRLIYDDEALYIGIQCYDREPDKIVSRLSRRDQWVESDNISVSLDPHHDHQTGFFFAVGPSGWRGDGILFNDTNDDDTWNGVWEAKASIHDRGWSVEYKIPYHVLRFSDKDVYTWGINIRRQISRRKERSYWILVPRGENGWVSRFGHLEGITGIHPPTHLEFLPFGVSRSSLVPKSKAAPNGYDQFSSMGLDLRYGLSSNISLNATVNPDFGQIEADPAVLNLGVFENFFQERRPFFLEGNTIFNAPNPDIVGIGGPSRLFYSRRIGRQPGRFSTPDGSDVIDRPDGTTILGAMKLSGKTARKTSFGLVEAVTASEWADLEQTVTDPITGATRTQRSDYKIEPRTNYLVGRVQQDIFTNSNVGATFTTMNGQEFSPAYVGGVDGQVKWRENAYRIFTRLSGSRTGPSDARKSGYEGIAYFSKFSGWLGGQTYFDARSPGFDANDLGFMNRAGRIQAGGHMMFRIRDPWALARESGFNINTWTQWNYDQVNLSKGINFNNWHTLKNYWFFNFGISRDFQALDDLATRGGPVMVSPSGFWFWSNLGTDSRKAVRFWLSFSGGRTDGGLSSNRRIGLRTTIRPASNIQLEINPAYRFEDNFAQWIENIDDNDDGEDDHYVFGELKNRILDITTRATASFTPDLSLQVYLQTFVAVGDYTNIKELARPASYAFNPFTGLTDNPDFNRRSLRSNLVLRWEYRPGSTVFLVWAQSRSASFDDPAFRPFRSVGNSFTDEGKNIFMVKMNYWFNM